MKTRHSLSATIGVVALLLGVSTSLASSPVTVTGWMAYIQLQGVFRADWTTNYNYFTSGITGQSISYPVELIGHTFWTARMECRAGGQVVKWGPSYNIPPNYISGSVTNYTRSEFLYMGGCPGGSSPRIITSARLEFKKTGFSTVYLEATADR